MIVGRTTSMRMANDGGGTGFSRPLIVAMVPLRGLQRGREPKECSRTRSWTLLVVIADAERQRRSVEKGG